MTRLMDKPVTAAFWLAIFGAAASAQGVDDGACRAPDAQAGMSITASAVEARTGAPQGACKGQGGAATTVPATTDSPHYAEAPKRSPHANTRSGRGSK